MPPTTERIMIYVKQESEEAFTALHLKPPTIQGLITALESKYKINGRSIRHLHRVNKFSHKVKIDDEMITHYSNEAAFYMQVSEIRKTFRETITLCSRNFQNFK